MAEADRPQYVDLIIQGVNASGRPGTRLIFEMQDGFQTGYENTIDEKAGDMLTHPTVYQWKGGKVKPFNVELDLHVGVQRFIPSSYELRRHVEALRDMCLPIGISLPSVVVMVRGGTWIWFACRAFVQSMGTTWMPPYDVETGMPLHAKVSLAFMPTYAAAAGGGKPTDFSRLPGRQWRFRSQASV